MSKPRKLLPYSQSLAGTLLAARETVMAPIRPALRDADVTEQQWRVLRVLVDEGPIDLSRLAESALLLAPSVTRILRELVDRDLIVRENDPSDGRRSIVAISKTGKALVDQTAKYTLTVLQEYEERFGSERLQDLIGELRAFIAAIEPVGNDIQTDKVGNGN